MKENDFILLVFKQLSGDISPEEAQLLRDWVRQSPENERMVHEYSMIWEKSGSYQKQFSPNLELDFAKVQARIRAEAQPAVKVSFIHKNFFRAAAAIALLALSVWGYSTFRAADTYDAVASAQLVDKQLVSLSDGTQVWLRQGSSMQYSTSFEGKKTRQVQLTGEAYFEVAHDPQHPFRVMLQKGGTVEVLGTQFNIQQSDNNTTVLVRSGKVRFSPDTQGVPGPTLTANTKGVFDRTRGVINLYDQTSFNELSWQTGRLEFVNTPLSQVVLDLEKYYKVKIALQNPAIADCPHNALLANQPLKNVLDGLAVAYQLKVKEISPGSFVLSGGLCR